MTAVVTGTARSADVERGPVAPAAIRTRPDLRLAVPAVAAWCGALLSTSPWWPQVWLAGCAAVVLILLGAAVWRWRQLAAVAAFVGLAAGLGMGTVRVVALHSGLVDDLARDGAAARLTLVVTADPQRHAGATAGSSRRGNDTVIVAARVVGLTARGRAVTARLPVLVLALDQAATPGWHRLLPGQRVRAAGLLRPAAPGQPLAAVVLARSPPELVGRPPRVQRAAGELRAGLRGATDGLPPGPRGLLPGLVLGDTSRMPPQLVDDFRTSGLTHLNAVSGANVAIVVGFVLLVARWLGARGRWLPVLGALAMVGFVVLARPQPSVLRAAAMGGVALLALASGRRRASVAALSGTVLVLVLVDPWLSRSYGFVLSVLATGALVMLAPGWTVALRERGLPVGLAAAVAVPLAAQAVCAPVVTMLSGQVSLVALPANLLVAPAVAPATVLGVLATVVSVVSDTGARWLATAGSAPAWWIAEVAQRCAAAPLASVGWSSSLPAALALAGLTAVVVAVVRRVSARPRWAISALLLLLVGLAVPASSPGWPPHGWVLVACDVGQGDALVLSAGRAGAVVVDAGPDPRLVDRCLRELGVNRVPLVLLTHMHADHVEGLPGVLRRRQVGEVVVGPYDEPVTEHGRVLGWARSAKVPVRVADMGEQVQVGSLSWEVFWPARIIEGEGSVPNNASLVLLVRNEGVQMLLTGDVEPPAQRALLARWTVAPIDVLKVPHHGSAYQTPELLAAVRPRVALISVGADNDYGHPAPVTLVALQRLGVLVRRTDRDGTVAVVGPPGQLRVVGSAGYRVPR